MVKVIVGFVLGTAPGWLVAARLMPSPDDGRTNFLAIERGPLRALHAWVEQFRPWWGTDAETLKNYAGYLDTDGSPKEETS